MDQFSLSRKKQITASFNPRTKNQAKPLGYKSNTNIKTENFKNETPQSRSKGLNLLGNLLFVPESSKKRKQNCMEANQPEKRIKIEEKTNNNSDDEEEKVFNYMTGVYEPVKKKTLESPKINDKVQSEGKEIKKELAPTENGVHHPIQSQMSLQVSNTPPLNSNLSILLTNENSPLLVQPKKESLVLDNAKDNSISSSNLSQKTPIKTLQKSMDISPVKGEYFNHSNNSINLSSEHLKLDDTFLPDNSESSNHSNNFICSASEQLPLDTIPHILHENDEHFNHSISSINSTPDLVNLDAIADILPENTELSDHFINSVHSPTENSNLEANPAEHSNSSITAVNLPPDHLILDDFNGPNNSCNTDEIPDVLSDNGEHSNHSITAVNLPPDHLILDDFNGPNNSCNTDEIPDVLSDNGEHSNHSITAVNLPPDHLILDDFNGPNNSCNTDEIPDVLSDNGEHSNHSITAVNLPPEYLNLDDSNQSGNSVNSAQVDLNSDDIPDVLSDNGEHSNHSITAVNLPPNLDNDEHSNHSISTVTLPPEHLNLDDTTKGSVLRDMLSNRITKDSCKTSNKRIKRLRLVSEINLSDPNENSNDSIVFDGLSNVNCLTSDANTTLKDSISNVNGSKTIDVEATNSNSDKVLPEPRQDLVGNLSVDNLEKEKSLTKWQCKTCGLYAGTKEKLISHLYNAHLKEDYEIKIKCKSCTFESSTPEEMKVHKLSHEKNDVRNKEVTVVGGSKNNTLLSYGFTLNCDTCKFNCNTLEEMATHRSGHNKNKQPEIPVLITRILKFKCNICKFECDTPEELGVHRLKHVNNTCSNNTNGIISIRDSESDTDDDNYDFDYRKSQQFRCFICNKYRTTQYASMKYHTGTHHNVEYYCVYHYWETPLKTCPKCIFENIKRDANACLLACKRCGYKTVRKEHMIRHKYTNCTQRSAENINGLKSVVIFQCYDCPTGFSKKDDLKIHAISNHPNSTYICPLHKSKVNFFECQKCIYELIFTKFDPKSPFEESAGIKSKRLALKSTETNKSSYHEPQEYTFTDSDSDSCEEYATEVAVTRSRVIGNQSNTDQIDTVLDTSLGNKSDSNQTETLTARSLWNQFNINQPNQTAPSKSLENTSDSNQTTTLIARSNQSNTNQPNQTALARLLENKSNNNQTKILISRSLGNKSNTNLSETVVARSLGNNSNNNKTVNVGLSNKVLILTVINAVPSLNRLKETGNVNVASSTIARGLTTDPDEVIVIDDSEEVLCQSKDTDKRKKEISAQCFDCKYSSADRDQNFLNHVCRHIGSKYQCVKHSKKKVNDCLKCFYEETLKNVSQNCKLCKRCGFRAADTLSLKRHQKQTNICKESSDQNLKSGEIKCFACNYITIHKKFLKFHMVDHLGAIFSCYVHPNGQNESCNKCINRNCLGDAEKEAKICKKCNFKTVIPQVFEKHNCKETVVNVLEQNNFQQVIVVDESEENVPVDKASHQSGKSVVTEKSVEKVILEDITMENTNSTMEVSNEERHIKMSETNNTDKTVIDYGDKAITQTPVVRNTGEKEISTEDKNTIVKSMKDAFSKINNLSVKKNNSSIKVVDQSVKINDQSATINDPSVKINDLLVNINDPSADINDTSIEANDQSAKINDQSKKINEPSVEINDSSVKPNDQSTKINDQSREINEPLDVNDQSVKPNDQSAKINDQSKKINEPSVEINDSSVKPNDQSVKINILSVDINNQSVKLNNQSVKINDQSMKINKPSVELFDPSVKPNNQSVKINDQAIKINEPSVDINDPSVKPNDQSAKINHQSMKINEPSVKINDSSVKPNDQSTKINDQSREINEPLDVNDQSVEPNDQSAKINDQSKKINEPSVEINDSSVKPNDQSVKINKPSVDINDPSVKPNDQSVKINEPSVHINDSSDTDRMEFKTTRVSTPEGDRNETNTKIDHLQSNGSENNIVKEEIKAKCYDCKFIAKTKGFCFKEHVSQHVGSKYQCLEHWRNKNFNCLKCYYEETLQTLNIEVKICRYCGYRALNTLGLKTHLNNSGTCTRWANRKLEAGHIRCFKCFFVTSKKQYLKYHMIDHLKWIFFCDLHRNKKNEGCEKCINVECLDMAKKEAKICKECNFKTVIKQVFKIHKCIEKSGGSKGGFSGTAPSLTPVFSMKVLPVSFVSSENVKTPQLDKTLDVQKVTKENMSFGCTQQTNDMDAPIINNTNDLAVKNDVDQNESVKQGKTYRCFDCDFSHNEKECLISHVVAHVNSNFHCDEHEKSCAERCDKCFYWQLVQDNLRCHVCYDCCSPKVITGKWNIQNHIKRFHINSVYVCNTHNGQDLECDKCSYQLMAQEINVSRKVKYRCFDCDFSHREKRFLVSHVVTHVNSNFKCDEHEKPGAERCDKCFYWQLLLDNSSKLCYDCCPPSVFSEQWGVKRHAYRFHLDSVYVCDIHKGQDPNCGKCQYQLMAQEINVSRKKYQCFDCDFSHTEKRFLVSHASTHKNSSFKCDVHKISRPERCAKCFYLKLLEELPKLKRCYDCRPPKAFSGNWHVQRHIKRLHKDSVYVCDIHDQQNLECGQCYYQSIVKKKKIIKKKRKYRCFDCDYSHDKQSFLINHVFTHKNSGFTCDKHQTLSPEKCGKCFYWQLLHRIPSFKRCYDCRPPKAFIDNWHLKRHIDRNHKKSDYVCKRHIGQNDKCDKCIYQLLISDVRPNGHFSCCECALSYKEKHNLLKHIRKCHLNSNFRCDMHIPSEPNPGCKKCIYAVSVKDACKTVKPNDQSAKMDDQSRKINEPSVEINDPSVKSNDQSAI